MSVVPADSASKVAFMPHVGSFWCFQGWQELLRQDDIHLIDPRDEPSKILRDIASCKVLLAEAMHGAIIADAIGVPWVPVKCYKSVNEFKWSDFCESLDLTYQPVRIDSLFDPKALEAMVGARLGNRIPAVTPSITGGLAMYHRHFVRRKVERQFRHLRHAKPSLSNREVFRSRLNRLLECAEHVRCQYSKA